MSSHRCCPAAAVDSFLGNENVLRHSLEYCDVIELARMALTCSAMRRLVTITAERCIAFIEKSYYKVKSDVVNYRRAVSRSPLSYLRELLTARVYVLRGFISFSFEISRRKWTRLPDLLRDRGYFQTVVLHNEIYAVGTYSVIATGTIEKYNFLSNTWAVTVNMPRKARSVAVAVFKGELHVLGGLDVTSDSAFANCYRLDLARGEWIEQDHPLLTARYRHSAVEYRGKLWLGGGNILTAAGAPITTNTVEVYCAGSGWTEGPSMCRRRDFFNLQVVEGALYAVGGDVDEAGNQTLRTIEVLSHGQDSWELIADFPNARCGFSTCAVGCKIYVFSGDSRLTDEHDNDHTFSTWDAFDVRERVWESAKVGFMDRHMPLIDNWGQAVTMPTTPRCWSNMH